MFYFSVYVSGYHRDLHSVPTRRASELGGRGGGRRGGAAGGGEERRAAGRSGGRRGGVILFMVMIVIDYNCKLALNFMPFKLFKNLEVLLLEFDSNTIITAMYNVRWIRNRLGGSPFFIVVCK